MHDNRIDVNLIESKEFRYCHYTREKTAIKHAFVCSNWNEWLKVYYLAMKLMLIKIGGGSNLRNETPVYGEYIPTRRQKRR